ncbi:MAG: hypothetical protein RIS92_3029 [Verrucomicrobiota bacterium]
MRPEPKAALTARTGSSRAYFSVEATMRSRDGEGERDSAVVSAFSGCSMRLFRLRGSGESNLDFHFRVEVHRWMRNADSPLKEGWLSPV